MPMHTSTRSSPPTPCRTPGIPNPAFPLYSQRCGTMTGDGGGISPLSPSYRDGCTLQPPAQCDATGTVPPSPTTALPVFFHCLHTPNPLFFANPKSGPIPPGDCIRSQTPPPKKKHKPLGIYSPTQQTPPVAWRWCGLGVPRSGGGRSPTAACLPAPAASSSAALLRSHSGTGAAAVPGPPSAGTAGAGAAAPPLLCKICPPPTPPTSFLPREPSPIATPPPPLPHICAQVGVYRIPFCPPLNPCPPRDVPAVPSRGTDAPPLRHTLSPHQTRPHGETGGPSPSGVCFTPYFLTFCNSPPRSHQ